MRLFFFLYLFAQSIITNAQPPVTCECLWQGSFTQIIENADMIISGEVINQKGNSMDVSIDRKLMETLTDQKEFNATIRIWGADGKQCRPKISNFLIGSEWLFALNKITNDVPGGFNPNTPNISYGRINDYYLSSCGAYWLELNDNYVSGNLINGKRWQWQDDEMNPVIIDLIDAYIKKVIPKEALVEAAKPQTEVKKLMEETKWFLRQQN